MRERLAFRDICYANRTRENDLRAASISLQVFFSGAFVSRPVSRTHSGEWSGSAIHLCCEPRLWADFVYLISFTILVGLSIFPVSDVGRRNYFAWIQDRRHARL